MPVPNSSCVELMTMDPLSCSLFFFRLLSQHEAKSGVRTAAAKKFVRCGEVFPVTIIVPAQNESK